MKLTIEIEQIRKNGYEITFSPEPIGENRTFVLRCLVALGLTESKISRKYVSISHQRINAILKQKLSTFDRHLRK